MEDHEIKKAVRDNYAQVAANSSSCCGPSSPCCCGTDAPTDQSLKLGYSEEELASLPEGANLGLGCGNPVAISSLSAGETVVDLGSGAGIDCFIAADKVGSTGRVIGVDMTHEMIDKARGNARRAGRDNVEFRLGELEHLPVADGEANVIISNCVINLVPDKDRVFSEVYRALAPGGRLAVSDMVLLAPWPEEIKKTASAYAACLAGASLKDEYLAAIERAGFEQVEVASEVSAGDMMLDALDSGTLDSFGVTREQAESAAKDVASIKVSAVKPAS